MAKGIAMLPTAQPGRRGLGGAAVCLLLFLPAPAYSQTPSRPKAGTAAPRAALKPNEVDVERSRAYVKVGATGLGHEHGCEGRLQEGTIALGAAHSAGKIVFDMKSFTADSAEARKYAGLSEETDQSTADQVTATLRGARVLDVARHPTAVFEIDSAAVAGSDAKTGATRYQLVGKFTLHGVTRPLELEATAEKDGDAVRLRGNFKILQSDHGIKPYTKLLGTIGVADSLTIWGDLWIQSGK
jgi:polyisoprenoid-binding protein YceI